MRVDLHDFRINMAHPVADERLSGAGDQRMADEAVPERVQAARKAELIKHGLKMCQGTPFGDLPAADRVANSPLRRKDPLGRSRELTKH